jgi:chromosome partitioning protein
VLEPFLSASVKIKESHQHAKPMVHLDKSHKLTEEFNRLYDALATKKKAAQQKKRA